MFTTKKPAAPSAPEVAAQPVARMHRILTTLEALRADREREYEMLGAQLIQLDEQIAWLKRHPQAEKILASLLPRV
jgi:hypothetical protein